MGHYPCWVCFQAITTRPPTARVLIPEQGCRMTPRFELAGNVPGGHGDRLGGAGAGHGEAREMRANGVTASQAILARPMFPKAR